MSEGPGINLAIVGSRGFHNYALLKRQVDRMCKKLNVVTIISGGAKGADQLGERYAREKGLKLIRLLPDWNGPRGKRAGLDRNTEIVAQADVVLAFWDGKSTGTHDTIKKTENTTKKLKIVRYLFLSPNPRQPFFIPTQENPKVIEKTQGGRKKENASSQTQPTDSNKNRKL